MSENQNPAVHFGLGRAKNRPKPELRTAFDRGLRGLEFRLQALGRQNENC